MPPMRPNQNSRRKRTHWKRQAAMRFKGETKPVTLNVESKPLGMVNSTFLSCQLFLSLPLDVMAGVCRFLHPVDILSLARTSKPLRAFFMSKHSKPLWNEVRYSLGFPDWRHVAAPQAMAFLFGHICQGIGCDEEAELEDFHLCRRYCPRCAEKNLIDLTDVIEEFPSLPGALLIHLPWTRKRTLNTHESAEKTRYYLKDDVFRLWRRFQACVGLGASAVAELHQSLAQTKKERKMAAGEVWRWHRNDILQRRKISAERWMIISSTMRKQWGWKPVGYLNLSPMLAVLVDYLINAESLSEEVWESVRGDMATTIQAEKRTKRGRPFSLQPLPA